MYAFEVRDTSNIGAHTFVGDAPLIDICHYLNGQRKEVKRLIFPPNKYPPPTSSEDMSGKEKDNKCTGWKLLKADLGTAALDGGNEIVCNGSNPSTDGRTDNRRFKCGAIYRKQRESKAMEVTASNQYRQNTLINNRSNNRPDGKSGPKRVKTTNKNRGGCNFGFTIKWDVHGFYVELERNSGYPVHCNHPRVAESSLLPFPTRYLTSDDIESTKSVVEATSNKAAGRNFLTRGIGRFINSIKIAYLTDKYGDHASDKEDDISKMIGNFEQSNEIAYTCLSR